MSMEGTGDLCEISGEAKFEWKIKDFLLLSDKENVVYESPHFLFSGSSWWIQILPNGHTRNASVGWIGLYIGRKSAGTPITAEYSFSLETVDGKSCLEFTYTDVFKEKDICWGFPKFILRSELIERKSEFLPSGVLSIICTLKNSKNAGVWKLQQHLSDIFLNGNFSDVVLKVDDQEFKSHRCILAARSPVFLAMMTHDTKERNSGVVDIPDADPHTFSDFLNYLYTGSGEQVTSENVLKLYTVADKYQVDELKNVCVDYMLKIMSVDNFCDILTLSLRHVEKDLTEACNQFFIKDSLAIVKTSKWQMFLSENPVAGNELYVKHLEAINERSHSFKGFTFH